jgi:hypothetical protein
LEYFSGDTSFDISLLPAELLDMITIYLDAEDEIRLFAASKSLQRLQMDHWQYKIQQNYPGLCRQITTWRDKIIPILR